MALSDATSPRENHPTDARARSAIRPESADCETRGPGSRWPDGRARAAAPEEASGKPAACSNPHSYQVTSRRHPRTVPFRLCTTVIACSQHLAHITLQLLRPMRRRVLAQYAASGAGGDSTQRVVIVVTQVGQDVLAAVRHQDFPAGDEELAQADPFIGHDRDPTRGGFEQSHARGVTIGDHVGTGDVQSQPQTVVELAVCRGRQVFRVPHVRGPVDPRRILSAGDIESTGRPGPGWPHEQLPQLRLPVGTVGPEITEVIGSGGFRHWIVVAGLYAAIERAGALGPPLILQAPQRAPAREGQIQVETRYQSLAQVLAVAALEFRKGDRGIDVIEGCQPLHPRQQPREELRALRNVGAEHHQIGAYRACPGALDLFEAGVDLHLTIVGPWQIPILRVPGGVPLKETHAMAPTGQCTHEGAIGGRMTVSPRRGDGQTENHDVERPGLAHATACAGIRPSSTASTSSARSAYV